MKELFISSLNIVYIVKQLGRKQGCIVRNGQQQYIVPPLRCIICFFVNSVHTHTCMCFCNFTGEPGQPAYGNNGRDGMKGPRGVPGIPGIPGSPGTPGLNGYCEASQCILSQLPPESPKEYSMKGPDSL